MDQVQVSVRTAGDVTVVAITGDMDITSGAETTRTFTQLIKRGCRRIVVDMAGVSFCDSTGLLTLLLAQKHLGRVGGRLVLAQVPRQQEALLQMIGLTQVLGLYATIDEAVRSLEGGEEHRPARDADRRPRQLPTSGGG